MLYPDSASTPQEPSSVLIKIVGPDGQTHSAYFAAETMIEEIKNKAIEFFYPNGETSANRFKLVRVGDATTLHDFLTIAQENIAVQDELLLVERRVPDSAALWELGEVRAPHAAAIVAATAALPTSERAPIQPNLQTLLSTNELSFELKKILISLIEAGAKLAAGGRNYETSLSQLCAALENDEPTRADPMSQITTPEQIANRLKLLETPSKSKTFDSANDMFHRAACLEVFLDKFRDWRKKVMEPPTEEATAALLELGFSREDAHEALMATGANVPAAAAYLVGERGSSVFELVSGLPDGSVLTALLQQPQLQRGLLNTRMLLAFIGMVGRGGSASLWMNSPHGSPVLSQISRTYHAEKYCMAVNQFSGGRNPNTRPQMPSTSRQRN